MLQADEQWCWERADAEASLVPAVVADIRPLSMQLEYEIPEHTITLNISLLNAAHLTSIFSLLALLYFCCINKTGRHQPRR